MSIFLHSEEALTSLRPPRGGGAGGKNLGNGWSKSIVLENEVVINFHFKHGANKSGHLDQPLQIYFNIFRYILRKAGLLWFSTSYVDQKQKLFPEGYALDYSWPSESMGVNAGTPWKEHFFQKMWFFGDLGFPSVILVNKPLKAQSQIQNGVSISSLPPFIVDLLTFEDYPTPFFSGNFRGC